MMRIGQVAKMIGDLPLVTVCLWEEILSHGEARNKQLWLDLLQRPSIGRWH
jgi:hypothetical protein